MGLDMYLFRAKKTPNGGFSYDYDTDEVGYWRKANAIHKWFVDNVQNGEDDCDDYSVSKELLEELLNDCYTVLGRSELVEKEIIQVVGYNEHGEEVEKPVKRKVIKDASAAEEILPAQSGFFFGDTSYDEWYISKLEYTIETILDVLKNTDFDTEVIVYSSSW